MGSALRVLGLDYLDVECTTGLSDGVIRLPATVVLTITAKDGHGDTQPLYATSATVKAMNAEQENATEYNRATV